jgi:hypothetical protein
MVAWKEPLQQRVLSQTGMRGTVVVSGVAYGDGGGGIPGLLLGSPRDAAGNLIMPGTGAAYVLLYTCQSYTCVKERVPGVTSHSTLLPQEAADRLAIRELF